MFGRIVRATFNGLIQWPDLMVFGLLTFALSFAIQLAFTPLWERIITGEAAVLPSLVLVVVQQLILTFGSYAIIVAATRIALSRMRGQPMSLREGVQIQPYLRSILRYVVVYSLLSAALIVAYLVLMFGPLGLTFASQMMTTGITGLSQISTNFNAGAACLIVLIFLPTMIFWLLANLLVPPVIAAENLGGLEAIRRSWSLVRRTLVVIAGLFLSTLIISFVLVLLTVYSLPEVGSVETMAADFAQPQFLIFNVILNALLFVVGAIFNAAWYYEALEASGVAGE